MKTKFHSAALLSALLAIFAAASFAQNDSSKQTIKVQSVGFVGGKSSLAENRPRVALESKRIATFELERKALELINVKRAALGLENLRWNEDVAKIARIHSESMAKNKFFNHVGLDGLTVDARADSIGLNKWRAISENIAYNRGFANPVEFACESWMKSVAHRENLLNNRWKETGVGIAVADDGTYYFTQVFLVR